jgi:hypothetical protein
MTTDHAKLAGRKLLGDLSNCYYWLDYFNEARPERETLITVLASVCEMELRALGKTAARVYELWEKPHSIANRALLATG